MAFSQIDPSRLEGDDLRRWYMRSPADIEQERQQADAQRYQDFFGGNDPEDGVGAPMLVAAQRAPSGMGMGYPPSALIQDGPASSPTAGAGGDPQLVAASWAPSADWICQACHGRGVLRE